MKTLSQFLYEIYGCSKCKKMTCECSSPKENNDPTPGKKGWEKEKKIINKINNSSGTNVN
jgi:hypothetical protein